MVSYQVNDTSRNSDLDRDSGEVSEARRCFKSVQEKSTLILPSHLGATGKGKCSHNNLVFILNLDAIFHHGFGTWIFICGIPHSNFIYLDH